MLRTRKRLILAVAAATLIGATILAQEKPKATLNDLSLDVAALQTLYQLQATPTLMKALRELAPKTASTAARAPAKASDDFRRALIDLRLALIEANDEDRINDLLERAEELREKESPTLDDGVEVTDEALEAAPRVFRLLSARQVAGFTAALAAELLDPLEVMMEALPKVRSLANDDWREFRTEIGDQIGTLLGGVDSEKAGKYRDQVTQLFIVARGLNDDEFAKQKPELEKKARAIIGDVGSLDVIRNQIEAHLAELLSNPRLEWAVDARLKQP